MTKRTPHTSGDARRPNSDHIYPLPAEVATAVARHRPSNFGLLFHRLIRYPRERRPGGAGMEWNIEGQAKQRLWKEHILRSAGRILQDQNLAKLYDALRERRNLLEQACRERFGSSGVEVFPLTVEWRMALGLSAASVMDTGMALHRVYGVPWLPASAVKGATRSYALETAAEKLGLARLTPEEIKARRQQSNPQLCRTPWQHLEQLMSAPAVEFETHWRAVVASSNLANRTKPRDRPHSAPPGWLAKMADSFRSVFGGTQERGQVIFFDAMPDSLIVRENGKVTSLLELDIINPHYPAYYRGCGMPPSDDSQPIPVNFLALRAGTQFRFMLASRSFSLVAQATHWLTSAAQQVGIGAKTVSGYGGMASS